PGLGFETRRGFPQRILSRQIVLTRWTPADRMISNRTTCRVDIRSTDAGGRPRTRWTAAKPLRQKSAIPLSRLRCPATPEPPTICIDGLKQGCSGPEVHLPRVVTRPPFA